MNKNLGSNLVEYVIPLGLIALVVGMGLFYIADSGVLKQSVMDQSGAMEDMLTNKVLIGTGALTNGVFKAKDGSIILFNAEGQGVPIEESYLNRYRDDIINYLNDNKFEFVNGSSLAVETSGAAGITDSSNNAASQTFMLSSLIEIAANNYDDDTVQEMLNNMSLYGKELAELEDNLIIIDSKISSKKDTFMSKEDFYNEAEAAFEKVLNDYESGKTSIDKLREAHETLENAYDNYENSLTAIQDTTGEFINMAESYFDDLKNNTGVKFDDVLEQIKASLLIDQDVKDLTVPIAEKIKETKDSAELIKQTIDYITGTFDKDNLTYEEFQNQFETIEFEIQQANQGQGKGP